MHPYSPAASFAQPVIFNGRRTGSMAARAKVKVWAYPDHVVEDYIDMVIVMASTTILMAVNPRRRHRSLARNTAAKEKETVAAAAAKRAYADLTVKVGHRISP
jgi:hypothetical protein